MLNKLLTSIEVPDLSFSEMKFLSRPSKPDNVVRNYDEQNAISYKPQIKEISEYFSLPQAAEKISETSPCLTQVQGPPKTPGDTNITLRDAHSKTPQSAPLILQSSRKGAKGLDTTKRTSRPVTNYTWSETNPEMASRQGTRSNDQPQAVIADSRNMPHGSPFRDVDMGALRRVNASSSSNFEYDPFIVSKTHDMIFRNGYIGEAQGSTAQSTEQRCYDLEELQTMSNRYIETLVQPESGLNAASKQAESTHGNEPSCHYAQYQISRFNEIVDSPMGGKSKDDSAQLGHLEPVKCSNASQPATNRSERAADCNRLLETRTLNSGGEDRLALHSAATYPPGYFDIPRNHASNVFLSQVPSKSGISKRTCLASFPQAFGVQPYRGSPSKKYFVRDDMSGDWKGANASRLEIQMESVIPATSSVSSRSEVEDEAMLYPDSVGFKESHLNDHHNKEPSNGSLDPLGWAYNQRTSPLAHQRSDAPFPAELQASLKFQHAHSRLSRIPSKQLADHISSQEQWDPTSVVSDPRLTLFWRPNKLY